MREGCDDRDVYSRMDLSFECSTFLEYNRTLGQSFPLIVSNAYVYNLVILLNDGDPYVLGKHHPHGLQLRYPFHKTVDLTFSFCWRSIKE